VIGAIVRSVKIPVISNGNVRSVIDVVNNLRFTGAAGIMSAEGILKDPTLFAKFCRQNVCIKNAEDVPERCDSLSVCGFCERNHELPLIGDIALEYLKLARSHPPPGTSETDMVFTMNGISRKSELLTEQKEDLEGTTECDRVLCVPTSLEYATYHISCFLQRKGKGTKTSFKFCGSLSVSDIRNRLAMVSSLSDLEELVSLTLPMNITNSEGKDKK
jgi:tRNA-dihydrouridine synthase